MAMTLVDYKEKKYLKKTKITQCWGTSDVMGSLLLVMV